MFLSPSPSLDVAKISVGRVNLMAGSRIEMQHRRLDLQGPFTVLDQLGILLFSLADRCLVTLLQ